MNSTSNGSSQGTKTPVHATQQPLRSLGTNTLLLAPGGVWDQECWLVQSYLQCSINLMLWSCPSANADGEGFSVLMWLEKPPYFTCRNKTNPNYSYLRLSFSQSYKFISTHPLSHNGYVSQSESHGTTPMAATGSVFPSSCSNFLSFTLNFGPHLWATSATFLEATLFLSAFHWE